MCVGKTIIMGLNFDLGNRFLFTFSDCGLFLCIDWRLRGHNNSFEEFRIFRVSICSSVRILSTILFSCWNIHVIFVKLILFSSCLHPFWRTAWAWIIYDIFFEMSLPLKNQWTWNTFIPIYFAVRENTYCGFTKQNFQVAQLKRLPFFRRTADKWSYMKEGYGITEQANVIQPAGVRNGNVRWPENMAFDTSYKNSTKP